MRGWLAAAARLYPRAWRLRYGEEFLALLEEVEPGWRTVVNVAGGAVRLHLEAHSMLWKWVAVSGLAGVVVALTASFLTPRQYESSAVVDVPRRDGFPSRADITKSGVVSRKTMMELIRRPSLDLYPKELEAMPVEDVIERMGRDIHMAPAGVGFPPGALRISFTYPDREKARRVVQELVVQLAHADAAANNGFESNWRAMWPSDPPAPAGTLTLLRAADLPGQPDGPGIAVFLAYGLGGGVLLGILTIAVFRRPKWVLRTAVFAAAGAGLACAVSLCLGEVYTGREVVRVVESVVPARLQGPLRAAQGGPLVKRIPALVEETFRPERLNDIIDVLGLDVYRRQGTRREAAAERMRRDISFQWLDTRTFQITFSYPEAWKAQRVVQELRQRLFDVHVGEQMAAAHRTANEEVRTALDRWAGESLEMVELAPLPREPVWPNRAAITLGGLLLGAGSAFAVKRGVQKRPQAMAARGVA